jgi:hypothetical protein
MIGRKFGGNFGSLPGFGRVVIFPPSYVPGSVQAESSDRIYVLNAQEVSLEDAGDIHLKRHQNHRP